MHSNKPTEVDSMNRLRVQAENKAALYRRALELACDGDSDKVAYFVSEAGTAMDEERAAAGVAAAPAPAGPLQQMAAGIEALDEGHDPLCMMVLRGKKCTCGVQEVDRG